MPVWTGVERGDVLPLLRFEPRTVHPVASRNTGSILWLVEVKTTDIYKRLKGKHGGNSLTHRNVHANSY
jgi:hypothetical protein